MYLAKKSCKIQKLITKYKWKANVVLKRKWLSSRWMDLTYFCRGISRYIYSKNKENINPYWYDFFSSFIRSYRITKLVKIYYTFFDVKDINQGF